MSFNFEAAASASGGEISLWKDIFWKYLSMADADRALSKLQADPNYERFDGNSRAHTLHWIHNMKRMGQPDFSVYADIATYAVFRNREDELSYVAFNASDIPRTVTFSDGFSMEVGPRELKAELSDETADTGDDVIEFPIRFNNDAIDWDNAFQNFDGGVSSVVANPDPTGINQTDRVARMIKNQGQPWGGTLLTLSEEIDTSEQLSILVWAPREESSLLFKIENSDNPDQNFEVNQTIPVSGEWVELTYDLSGANPDFSYDSVVLIFDLGTMGDGSEGFTWYYDQIGYLSATSSELEMEVPSNVKLGQNYPNPFNPTTQISYSLPESMEVNLDVYNVTGQRVATLVSGQQSSGFHTATFDADRLSSGIYFYRLTSGNYSETKKMLLVK